MVLTSHFFLEVSLVLGFGDESEQLRADGGWGVCGNFIWSKFCSIQADQLCAGTSEKSEHVHQATDI